MDIKHYQNIRLVITVVLAVIFSQAIIFRNFIIPIMFLIAASVLLMYLRGRVKEVIADERDYLIGGKSALLAVQIFSWIAVIFMFVFYSFREINPVYEAIGMTLAFSVSSLMIMYSIIFRIKSGVKLNKKMILISASFAIVIAAGIVGARILGGEDSWLCENGQWQKHGNPSSPAPDKICGEEKVNADQYIDGQTITWVEGKDLIKNCEVEKIFQAHSLNVSIELKDGIRLKTVEPKIDDVLTAASESELKCGHIQVGTE